MVFRFNDIEICNFRGIDHLEIKDFGSLNVFVGANNVGKTSVLEAIFMLSGMSNPFMPTRINSLRNSALGNIDWARYLFHNLDFSNKPLLKAKSDDGARRLTFEPVIDNDDSTQASVSYSHPIIKRLNFDFGTDESDDYPYHAALFLNNANVLEQTVDSNYIEKTNCLFLPADKNDGNALANFATLVKRNSKQVVVGALHDFDQSIETIEALPDGLYIKMSGVRELLPVSMAGDGVRRMINIISSIANEDNNIVLIDEFDNGLHYSAHKKMWTAIMKFILRHDVQLFVTTHNIDCLLGLNKAMEDNEDFRELANVYDIAKTKMNGYQAYKYSYSELREAIEKEIEIRK